MTKIYHIEKGLPIEDPQIKEKVGSEGYSLLEQAALSIPVPPGFIIELSALENGEKNRKDLEAARKKR